MTDLLIRTVGHGTLAADDFARQVVPRGNGQLGLAKVLHGPPIPQDRD